MPNYPAIKIAIIFCISIIVSNLIEINFYVSTALLFISVITAIYYYKSVRLSKHPILRKIAIGASIFLLFLFYSMTNTTKEIIYPLESPKLRNASVEGEIIAIDLLKQNNMSFTIKVNSINEKIFSKDINNKFVCSLWKDSTVSIDSIYKKLGIGNIISLIGTVSIPKNQRNPGEFDYRDYLAKAGITGIINCYKPKTFSIINHETNFIQNLVFIIRKGIDDKICELYNDYSSALLKGILLADRSDIDYETRTSFVNSGVIHVLAVSGLHVGFITVIFFLLLGRFDIKTKYYFTILGLLIFLIITGGHASVFRASTMAIVYLMAKLSGRSTNAFNSISIAGIIILLLDPNELFNPGFQLSFSAVLSILIIHPIISKKIAQFNINIILKRTLLFLSVSLAAQLGTLPFTLVYFEKLSLISLFANFIVIPIIGIVVSIGIISLFMSTLSLWIASVFASANSLLIDLLYTFVDQTGNLSFSFISIFGFSLYDGIIFYSIIVAIFFVFRLISNLKISIALTILLVLSFLNYISLDNQELFEKGKLSILTIDVGQGDAILIILPDGKSALIDAGNATEYFDNGSRIITPLLNRVGIDKLDYALISHLDSDHFAGSISLIEGNRINSLVKPKNLNSVKDSIYEEYLHSKNIDISYFSHSKFNLSGCQFYFLNDTSNYLYKNFDSNNKSGIIKIVYGKNSFLFVGDAEHEAEEYLISNYGNFLNSEVLKIGHHGSKSSSGSSFLEHVNPKIGIISAGIMNKFNHPSQSVIERFESRDVTIYRTDYEGAILLISDGEVITKKDWR